MTNKKNKDREEFFEKFGIRNKSSNTRWWWIVPSSGEKEVASPIEVWNWIEQKKSEWVEEGIKEGIMRMFLAVNVDCDIEESILIDIRDAELQALKGGN